MLVSRTCWDGNGRAKSWLNGQPQCRLRHASLRARPLAWTTRRATSTATSGSPPGQLVAIQSSGDAVNASPLIATERGRSAANRLRAAREEDLAELPLAWSPEREPELLALTAPVACELIREDLTELGDDEGLRTAV